MLDDLFRNIEKTKVFCFECRYDMDNDPDGLIELTHTVTLEEDYPAGNHIFYGRIYTRGKKLLNVHTFSILIGKYISY